jgi:hypothetical protein
MLTVNELNDLIANNHHTSWEIGGGSPDFTYIMNEVRNDDNKLLHYWIESIPVPNTYYVCEKFGTVWSGKVSEMRHDYDYPENSTWYFNTKEKAEDFEFAMLMD